MENKNNTTPKQAIIAKAKAQGLHVTDSMSVEAIKTKITIFSITAKPLNERTKQDQQRLTNALIKEEHKNINWVYAQLREAFHGGKDTILGKAVCEQVKESAGAKFPSKKAFLEAHGDKGASFYFAIGTLLGLNPNYARAQKVKRQNKAQAKKA